jgi:arabinan endo-1,5-alpha-L-arabinosidase
MAGASSVGGAGAGAGAPSAGLGGAGANGASAGASGARTGASGASGASGSAAGQGGVLAAGAAGASGSGATAGSGGAPLVYPPASSEHRAIGTHDPSVIHVANKYYLFATGGLLGVRSSTNLAQWANAGTVFSALPAWIKTALGQTINDLWAPDISYVDGSYRLYYSGSTFGSNHSVIGLATNTTLDPQNAAYKWVDQGLVIESNPAGSKHDWNAIDPNVTTDAAGNWWLVFGSFWSGIKLRRLDTATGKLSSADTTLYGLASHSGGIEAPSIVSHNGYYYLFVSYDTCCKGINSTYRTMVGRATAITGPYTDQNGKAMLQGNALQLLATEGRYIGPGGGSAFRDGDLYYYVYHYYDGQMNGASQLMLRPIHWKNDWPELAAPLWQ